MNIKLIGSVVAASLLSMSGCAAAAEQWPAKPVRVIVAFAPGSTPDIVARMVSENLSLRIGKPVIVENKPGAAGNIGTDAVAKAAPDGYTLGVTISGPLAANTLLFRKMPYNPKTDFELLSIAATQPSVLVVSPQFGVNDMPALLTKLRSNQGQFNYSSMGNGSISHLAMASLASHSGAEIVHVPYPGSGQAVTAILGGDTQMAVLPAATVMPHIRAGKLKALAVATAKRSSVLKDLPTFAEFGLQDIQGEAWIGFIAPAKTPAAIVTKLQTEIGQIVNSGDMKQKLHMQMMEPVGGTPAQFRATLKSDLERWQPVIKKNNITLD